MLAEAGLAFVRELVRKEAAIILDDKEYLIEARLTELARARGLASMDALAPMLGPHAAPDLKRDIVEAMTTNETSFFRDQRPFEILRTKVLPGLVDKRSGTKLLRIWCGACSSGQEPYSLAMLIRESFAELLKWRLDILATDYSEKMLETAKRGVYRQLEVTRGLPAQYLAKYFQRAGAGWQISDTVRSMVQFQQLNLVRPWSGLGTFDLVLMRNVLIYFDVPTKEDILTRVANTMAPDALLFMGAAESGVGLKVPLKRVDLGSMTAYCPG